MMTMTAKIVLPPNSIANLPPNVSCARDCTAIVAETNNVPAELEAGLALLLAFLSRSLFSARQSFDSAPKHQANPEVDNYAEVHLAQPVTGGRGQVRHQQEVHDISDDDRDEALQQIHSSLF